MLSHALQYNALAKNFHLHSGFTGAKDDGRDGNNWSYKTCKAPVKSSSPTIQRPNNTVGALKKKRLLTWQVWYGILEFNIRLNTV